MALALNISAGNSKHADVEHAEHVEQIRVDSGASGTRIIEVRLGPDRVAERRSALDSNSAPRDFQFLGRDVRPVSESGVSGGFARDSNPPLYHLHAALLI